MDGALTRGQPTALAGVRSMIARGVPHAVLFVGPPSVGKTTLALDLAAALLCEAERRADRPCRACRGCRLVASGNHPDLHRLRPGGAGNQIKISATTVDPRPGIRELVGELSLMPVEGGARVAVVEGAHRMNEDAQNALLKTLEEPPTGVVILLCADDEDRLLSTIRSRCQRIRLGTVAVRDMEAWLTERGAADAPAAARFARLSAGRPGLALSYAASAEATAARAELDRTLIDLLATRPSARLVAVRKLLVRAAALAVALEPDRPADPAARSPVRRARRGAAAITVTAPSASATSALTAGAEVTPAATETPGHDRARGTEDDADGSAPETEEPASSRKASPAERRRAALLLVDVWRDCAVDLRRAELGDVRRLHDPALLEEVVAVVPRMPAGALAGFLRRLDRASRAIEGNASPELALDVLALAWPRATVVA